MWSELRAPLLRVRDAASERSAALWESCAGLLSHALAPVPRWTASGGARVLVFAPHPDDELYGCGGALLRHLAAGDPVTVCVLTDGRLSRALGLGPERMARRRRREAEACAALCGYTLSWTGLFEGALAHEATVRACREALDAASPALVYAPSCADFHPEHLRSARAIACALEAAHAALPVRMYGVQVPLTPLLTNRVVPMDGLVEKYERAVCTHASQAHSLGTALRLRRQTARFHREGSHAEALYELDSARYAATQARSAGHFRGMRPQPFTDPLSYLVGLARRRRLR